MTAYNLVVSDPPQDGVLVDETAHCLGLTAEEVRGKMRYIVPEIWYAHTNRDKAERAAGAMRAAGCRVVLISSDDLVGIPPTHRVRSFSFTADGMVVQLDHRELSVAYDAGIIAVSCRPRERADGHAGGRTGRPSGFVSLRDRLESGTTSGGWAAPGGADDVPFFDLLLPVDGVTERVTVVQNAVDYSGLGHVQPRAAANLAALVERCEDRFRRGTIDRRLEGMRLRHRAETKRAPDSEHRRGFSFASPAFNELLAEAAPALAKIPQPEFAARLAFLTKRAVA